MIQYDFLEAKWVISEKISNPLQLYLIFIFVQLFMEIETYYDQIWLTWDWPIDFEQCVNRLQLYLISLFVNFSCELG